MKNYYNFLLENKMYLYSRKFRLQSLIDDNFYNLDKIEEWMNKYKLDNMSQCVFVTEEQAKDKSKLNLRLSTIDIHNKNWFDSNTKSYIGYFIEDSEKIIDDDKVYLYVFRKNSNDVLRARQNHGFIYESEIKRLNDLKKTISGHKWDAVGNLDKKYLDDRINKGKNIEFFDGFKYSKLLWNNLIDDFKETLYWSIKCIKTQYEINMGDFLRISGYERVIENDNIKLIKKVDNVKNFILNVAFHDSNDNIIEEYIVLMPVSEWIEYLPDIETDKIEFEKMYSDLIDFKLIGEREKIIEENWSNFMIKYKKLTLNSIIKLRFKRDSKGQLRIQSSISHNNFKVKILKNKHIKIS